MTGVMLNNTLPECSKTCCVHIWIRDAHTKQAVIQGEHGRPGDAKRCFALSFVIFNEGGTERGGCRFKKCRRVLQYTPQHVQSRTCF